MFLFLGSILFQWLFLKSFLQILSYFNLCNFIVSLYFWKHKASTCSSLQDCPGFFLDSFTIHIHFRTHLSFTHTHIPHGILIGILVNIPCTLEKNMYFCSYYLYMPARSIWFIFLKSSVSACSVRSVRYYQLLLYFCLFFLIFLLVLLHVFKVMLLGEYKLRILYLSLELTLMIIKCPL